MRRGVHHVEQFAPPVDAALLRWFYAKQRLVLSVSWKSVAGFVSYVVQCRGKTPVILLT